MTSFIISLILLLIAVALFVIATKLNPGPNPKNVTQDEARRTAIGGAVVAGVFALLGLFLLIMDSFTVVPARNVGVVVTFGKAERTLSNGWHWVKPWSSVEKIDATVQTLRLNQGDNTCVTVRLANQTTACVDATVQWNVDQHANANELWQRYRGTNDDVVRNVRQNVVERQLQRAFNVVFEVYNPLAVLSGGQMTVKTDDLAAAALRELRAHVDPGINIDSVVISLVHFDEVTQSKLNGYAQALADTQIATQQKLTAEQQRQANEKLAQSGASDDPGVLYQNCLNLIASLAAKGQLQNLPPTFNCNSVNSPVIVGK